MSAQEIAMRKLGFTDEEIADVLATDKRIDRGEKLFELTTDQKQAEKKMRQADRKPTVYNFPKRERKPNESKRAVLAAFVEVAQDLADNGAVDVANVEREFSFVANGTKYKVVLSVPRS